MNLSNITQSQKSALVALLTMVMEADGFVHPKETEYLDRIFEELDVEFNEIDRIENLDISMCCKELSTLENEQKEQVKQMLNEMAWADGLLDERESRLINKLKF